MLAAPNSSGTNRLLRLPGFRREGQAIGEAFARHRERLRKVVRLRLDWRLRGRVSSSTLLDRVLDDARRHIDEFPGETHSFFLWLRELTVLAVEQVHRQYLGDRADGPGTELHLCRGATPRVTAASMAAQLLGDPSANQDAARADMLLRLQGAINAMDALDREILALRNFEELTTDEAAAVLGLSRGAATVRHLHAAKRLNEILATIPGFLTRGKP